MISLGRYDLLMVGNRAMRALGDTKTSVYVMMIAAGINVILDPLLILGYILLLLEKFVNHKVN